VRQIALIASLVITFLAAFPVAIRLADSFFTFPFHSEWRHPVLLVWPDHVEMRWFDDVSEVSPRPKDATCTFNIAPERQAWIEKEVRKTPSPNGNAAWVIHVRQLGPSKQRVQLELIGDGISGIIYEARSEGIVPLNSRAADPADAIVILGANLLVWGSFWLLVWIIPIPFHGKQLEHHLAGQESGAHRGPCLATPNAAHDRRLRAPAPCAGLRWSLLGSPE
jgi:hypothetical protein